MVTPQAAARELLLRERMRTDLVEYARSVPVPGRPVDESDEDSAFLPIESTLGKHHILLLQAWQKMTETPYGRLMVLMPPGSAKSTYASVVGPAWWLSAGKNRRCILTSYGDPLATKHGRRTRQLLRDPRHRETFDVTLNPESHAAHEFSLTNLSEYMAAGILGAITGNRAGGLVIDDPYKGREAADSDLIRGSIQDAYEDDLLTRLYPGAWVCLIQTRWHELDLAGRILPEDWKGESGMIKCRDGQTWNVICLQAQCDVDDDPLGRARGEYLWPEWFDERHWQTFRAKARTWASLYQQLPSSQEGIYFKRDWFRRYRNAPKYVHNYISSDHAPGGTESNDFNVLHTWGMDHLGDIYLMERFHKQCVMDKVTEKLILFIKRWDPLCWFPENDNNYKACAGFIKKAMWAARAFCRIEPITPHGNNKEVKAQPFQAMASMGKVWIMEGPEGDDVIDMFCKFPAGGKDDTDAAGTFCRAIEMAHEAIIPVQDPKRAKDRWLEAFGEETDEGDSWKTV